MNPQFEKVIRDVSEFLQLDLKPDESGAIGLKLRDFYVQIEPDEKQENLLIFSPIGDVPEGRYREDILEQALRSNAFPPPNLGILCMSKKTGKFYIYESFPMRYVSKEQLFATLPPLLEKVKMWKEALEHAQIPIIEKPKAGGPPPSIQDLMNLLRR